MWVGTTPTETADRRPAPRRQARGVARRDAIVRAAADLILQDGPAAVTHRAVATRADVPLAATTYYFTGLDDLMGAAGEFIVTGWAEHAHGAAERAARGGDRAREDARVLVDAVLPPGGESELRGFYEHLVAPAATRRSPGPTGRAGRGWTTPSRSSSPCEASATSRRRSSSRSSTAPP